MIKIKGLSKKYKQYIFRNFSCEFNKGLYLVVGNSGKGKTTLLNILSGVDKKIEGKISISEEVLYFKDKNNLPSDLLVKEVFCLFELANDVKINYYFDIKKLMKKKIKKLSLGEKQLVILNMVLITMEIFLLLPEQIL